MPGVVAGVTVGGTTSSAPHVAATTVGATGSTVVHDTSANVLSPER